MIILLWFLETPDEPELEPSPAPALPLFKHCEVKTSTPHGEPGAWAALLACGRTVYMNRPEGRRPKFYDCDCPTGGARSLIAVPHAVE